MAKQDATRPSTRSKTRTVDGAAASGELGLSRKVGSQARAKVRRTELSGVNAAIDVGKFKLDIALGSDGELFSEPKESRAITRLAELCCARVLLEGGSYQNVLVGALRAAGLPVVIINPR